MTSRFLLSPFTQWDMADEEYLLYQVRDAQFRNCTMEEIADGIPLWRHRERNADSITKAGSGH